MPKIFKIILTIIVSYGLFSLLFHNFPDTSSNEDKFNIIYYLLLLALVGSGIALRSRRDISASLKQAGIWVIIFISVIVLYGMRNDITLLKEKLLAELLPSRATVTKEGALEFRISSDGHFRINTITNGAPVRFMLDTGASDVVIPPHIAEKLGFEINKLKFTKIYNTANGKGRGAPIIIKSLQIGDFIFNDIRASVNETEMESPLLGMSFLEKISSYEVKNNMLIIYP